jgi:hypothetical protein
MSISSSEPTEPRKLALALAAELERGTELDPDACAVLFAALVRTYGRRVREGIDNGEREFEPPYADEHGVTASDVVFTAGEMIRAAGVSSFELSVWNY